jgi:hypothetical protein
VERDCVLGQLDYSHRQSQVVALDTSGIAASVPTLIDVPQRVEHVRPKTEPRR